MPSRRRKRLFSSASSRLCDRAPREARDLEAQLDVGDVVGVQVAEEMDDVEEDAGDRAFGRNGGARGGADHGHGGGRGHAAAHVRRHQQELRERHDSQQEGIGTGG